MKRVVVAFVSTVAGLVLLLSFKTQKAPAGATAGRPAPGSTGAPTSPGDSAPAPSAPGPSTAAPPTASPPTSGSTNTAQTRTVTGSSVRTRYGNVQVRITLAGNRITAVDPIRLPDSNGRDQLIDQEAVPILIQETLAAQSAQIDVVSGATYTSDGYARSLQSALDKAKA
jgi:uncharacterized protein with FMN-binding domain